MKKLKPILILFAFFLVIFSISVSKPVRSSILMATYGSGAIPYAWLSTGLIIFAFVLWYQRILEKWSPTQVIILSAVGFSAVLFPIRYGLEHGFKISALLFYIWSDVFSVILVEQIWSYTDDHFESEEAKMFYGLIGAGGILGGIAGSLIAAKLTAYMRTEDMILFCVAPLLLITIPVMILDRHERNSARSIRMRKHHGITAGFKLVFSSRYLKLMLASVIVGQLVSNVIDLQFNFSIEKMLTDTSSRTAFIGKFLAWMNVCSLFVAVVVTPLVHNFIGVRTGLLALPGANMLGTLAILFLPGAAWVFALKLMDKSLNYSINRASKELLYVPTAKEVKFKAKAVLDMFAYRFSEILGAIVAIPAIKYFGFKGIGTLNLLFIGIWIWIILKLAREYEQL